MENQNIKQKTKRDGLILLLIFSIVLIVMAAASIVAFAVCSSAISQAFHGGATGPKSFLVPAIPYIVVLVLLLLVGAANIVFSIITAVKAKSATYVGSAGLTRATFIILPIVAVSLLVVAAIICAIDLSVITAGAGSKEELIKIVDGNLDNMMAWIAVSGGTICAVGILQTIFCAINLRGKKKQAERA